MFASETIHRAKHVRECAGHEKEKKRKSIHLPDLITLSWTNNRSSKLHMEEFVFEIRPIQGMIVGFQRGARVFLVNMPLQTGRVALARKREQNTRPYTALGSLSRSPRVHFILASARRPIGRTLDVGSSIFYRIE